VLGYAALAIPWTRVVPATGLVLVLMELVRRWPYTTWALQGAAVGLVAGATAWSLDEPAARIVDTSPRSLAWRTFARLPAIGLLVAAWVLAAVRSWESLGGHGSTVLLQGVAGVAVAGAWATWRRAGGVAMPGTIFAAGVIPAALVWGLTRLSAWIPVFPYVAAHPNDWAASSRGWWVAGCLALVVLAAALADAHWGRPYGAPAACGPLYPRDGDETGAADCAGTSGDTLGTRRGPGQGKSSRSSVRPDRP
jgi:hypothetical protein